MTTTTDLAKFGSSERKGLVRLLNAWREQGLPHGFYDDEVVPMMNTESGSVFLTNSEYQAAMMNGDKLEIWHHCSNCGHEGFEEDCQVSDDNVYCVNQDGCGWYFQVICGSNDRHVYHVKEEAVSIFLDGKEESKIECDVATIDEGKTQND